MDYIFDWARDVYRKNIMDQIVALAADTTTTLAADTDLMTVVGNQYRDVSIDFRESTDDEAVPIETGPYSPQLLQFFDQTRPTHACIRDARFMVHEVVGIDITKDNFEDYLSCISKDASRERRYARKLQQSLSPEHAWYVSAGTIDAIEYLWTGKDREHEDFRSHEDHFVVNFVITSQIERTELPGTEDDKHKISWQQVHTLYFVAISEDVIDMINEKSVSHADKQLLPAARNVDNIRTGFIQPGHKVDKSVALPFFEKIRNASVRECLASAVTSNQTMTSHDRTGALRSSLGRPRLRVAPTSYMTTELPKAVYALLKVGRTQLEAPFLRTSSFWHEQKPTDTVLLSWLDQGQVIPESEQVLFVYAVKETRRIPVVRDCTHCIFVIDPVLLTSQLSAEATVHKVMPATSAWRLGQGRQALPFAEAIGKARSSRRKHERVRPYIRDPRTSNVMPCEFADFVERLRESWDTLDSENASDRSDCSAAVIDRLIHLGEVIGEDEEQVGENAQPLIEALMPYGFRTLIPYLRALTRNNGYVKDAKGIIVIDDDDDNDHQSPPKRRHVLDARSTLVENPPGGLSMRSYITIDDEEEDTRSL